MTSPTSGRRRSKNVARCEKIVSHDRKFVCICVPKSARTSLIRALTTQSAFTAQVQQTPPLQPLLSRTSALNSYFIFAFVRNPWARVVSAYINKVSQAHNERQLKLLARLPGLRAQMPFEEYIEWLLSPHAADPVADRHWASQHLFTCVEPPTISVDYLGRYERLHDDFAAVCRTLGLGDLQLPSMNTRQHFGVSEESETYWRSYYTSSTADIVAQRYATDIELFDYERPTL